MKCEVCGAPWKIRDMKHTLCLFCWIWAAAATLCKGGPTWGESRPHDSKDRQLN